MALFPVTFSAFFIFNSFFIFRFFSFFLGSSYPAQGQLLRGGTVQYSLASRPIGWRYFLDGSSSSQMTLASAKLTETNQYPLSWGA